MQTTLFTNGRTQSQSNSQTDQRKNSRQRNRIRATISVDSTPAYDRSRDLPGLLALWPWEIENLSLERHQQLVSRLRMALRRERQRAVAGRWTYDLARHARLLAAYRSEAAMLEAKLENIGRPAPI